MAVKKTCSEYGCGKKVYGRGLCAAHYWKVVREERKQAALLERARVPEKFSLALVSKILPIFEKPTDIPVWQWTQENISLPNSEGYQGATHPDWSIAPDMKVIFEDLKNPDVREIVLMFSSQSSKTLFEICSMAYLNWLYKASIMFAMPSERLFKRIPRRLKAIYQKSNVDYREEKGRSTIDHITLGENVIEFALSTSADSLAEKPCQAFVMDEVDEIPEQNINPYQLIKSRTRTFRGRDKGIIASTPKKLSGESGILDLYTKTKRHVLGLPCPHCGEYSEFTFSNIHYPEDVHYSNIRAENLAWAECPKCSEKIGDEYHDDMVLNGKWICLDPEMREESKGYQKSVWGTIFENWSSCAAAYLEKKEAGINDEKDFWNSWAAQPINLEAKRIDVGDLDLRRDYKRGEIPEDVLAITAGVDIGQDEAWITFIGWAPSGRMFEFFSARIDLAGRDFEHLNRAIIAFQTEDWQYLGKRVKPRFIGGCIDAGYNTGRIYDFCRKNPAWKPVMGNTNVHRAWTISPADPTKRYKEKARGVMLYSLNSYYWQDELQTSLSAQAENAGSFSVPADAHDRYITHLNNEQKVSEITKNGVRREIWKPVYKRAPQHLRDATIYSIVAGRILELDNIPEQRKITAEMEMSLVQKAKSRKQRITPLGKSFSSGRI